MLHPTAIISPTATIGNNVSIGPYCVVGEHVTLGDGVQLVSHVAVEGRTQIGAGTRIFPFSSIGHIPQDLKYKGEPSTLVIGQNCTIRENVTINPGLFPAKRASAPATLPNRRIVGFDATARTVTSAATFERP